MTLNALEALLRKTRRKPVAIMMSAKALRALMHRMAAERRYCVSKPNKVMDKMIERATRVPFPQAIYHQVGRWSIPVRLSRHRTFYVTVKFA